MLDKAEYYHGAAVIRLLEDSRGRSIRKLGALGYVANEEVFLFLKYTTKYRSPWGFTFDEEDVERCLRMEREYKKVVLGLVCGGDGICALDWAEGRQLLGIKSGRIVAARKHNHSYSVWGTAGELKRKIAVGRWPSLVFETQDEITVEINQSITSHV